MKRVLIRLAKLAVNGGLRTEQRQSEARAREHVQPARLTAPDLTSLILVTLTSRHRGTRQFNTKHKGYGRISLFYRL